MPVITVQVGDPVALGAADLIAQLDAYQSALYPAESNHLMPISTLQQPDVTFLTVAVDGRLAGCGAFVNREGDYAEIKRMFVAPEFRGLGLGRRILDELETLIRAAGLAVARLETGVSQPEALGLYEKAGYVRRGPFGDYPDHPLCVFMEKSLS
jgi:putative acetyltransferase